MKKLAWLLFGLVTSAATAQGVRFDTNITTAATNVPVGAQAPVYTVPYAKITVCGYPATPTGVLCTNTIPAYSDQALTSPVTMPITADAIGSFGFWLAPGTYSYSVVSSGQYVGTYAISIGSGGANAITGTNGITASTVSGATTVSINPPGAINALNINDTKGLAFPTDIRAWNLLGKGVVTTAASTWKANCVDGGNNVVYDPWDSPSAPWVMLYGGSNTSTCDSSGGPTTGNEQIGALKSADGINWTDISTSTPLFPVNPTGGQPDSGGVISPKPIRSGGIWYLFYTCTATAGFENGTQNMCLATTPNLIAPTWTRLGIIINAIDVPWTVGGSNRQIYAPDVMLVNGVWYIFFNAGTDVGQEDVGYASSTVIAGPYTLHSTKSLCRAGIAGCPSSGGQSFPSANALADPKIIQFGHFFVMYGWTFESGVLADYFATTTDEAFPNGWQALSTNIFGNPIMRASIASMNGQMRLFGQTGTGGSSYNETSIDSYVIDQQPATFSDYTNSTTTPTKGVMLTGSSSYQFGTLFRLFNNAGYDWCLGDSGSGTAADEMWFQHACQSATPDVPFSVAYGANPQVRTTSAGGFTWSISGTLANTAGGAQTGIFSPSADVINIGNGTPANTSAGVYGGHFTATVAVPAGSYPSMARMAFASSSAYFIGYGANTSTQGTVTLQAASSDASVSTTAVLNSNGLSVSNITAGASPICPNGTGGAFTTSGCTAGGGSGTVTSVALSMPGVLFNSTVPGSPVTTSGTLAPTLVTQTANTVLAGPSSGGAATPTFRSLVSADVPTLNQNTTGTAASLSGGALGSAPYQSAASTTAFIASPTTTDTYFYGWTPTGSAIAPAAKSLTTYLAAPPAIGGTTPAAITGTTLNASETGTSTIFNLTTTNAAGAQLGGVLCPNLTSSACSFGFGKSLTSGNSLFLAWWYNTTSFGSIESYANASPLTIRGNYVVLSGQTSVNAGGSGVTLGTTCAAGIALCVNTGSTMTVDTSGNVIAPRVTLTQGDVLIASSATPTFNATYAVNSIILTANVTSSTLAAGNSGQHIALRICQDATGSRTFTFPANVKGAGTIGTTASACNTQGFDYYTTSAGSGAGWYASGPMVMNQ